MVAEVRPQYPSQWAAITAVAGVLGSGTPETLRTWIRRSEVDSGVGPGVTSQMAQENRALRKEIAELRRALEVLKAARVLRDNPLAVGRNQSGSRALRRHLGVCSEVVDQRIGVGDQTSGVDGVGRRVLVVGKSCRCAAKQRERTLDVAPAERG